MSTVTYKAQPAIHKTRGAIPLEGNEYLYKVTKVLWPEAVERVLADYLLTPSLHVCSGLSKLGDVRLDLNVDVKPNIISDAALLPFRDNTFKSVLCDPPYNSKLQWNHDLLGELARVASHRIIFQHWYCPVDKLGRYRKMNVFEIRKLFAWMPQTYFGRMQMISIFDSDGQKV